MDDLFKYNKFNVFYIKLMVLPACLFTFYLLDEISKSIFAEFPIATYAYAEF